MKLVGRLTSKSFEIFKKSVESYTSDQALVKINFGSHLSIEIVRHSTTLLTINSNKKGAESLQISLLSSYERDLFCLLFRKLNEVYCKDQGRAGSELREIDFYRKRETYLQR